MTTWKLYTVLDLEPKSTEEQIKKNYRKLALKWHPDKPLPEGCDNKEEQAEMFKLIQNAYELLSNSDFKNRYDRFGDNISSEDIRRSYASQEEYVDPRFTQNEERIRQKEAYMEYLKKQMEIIEEYREKMREINLRDIARLKEIKEKGKARFENFNKRTKMAEEIGKSLNHYSVSPRELDSKLWNPYRDIYEKLYGLENEAEAIAYKGLIIAESKKLRKDNNIDPNKKIYLDEIIKLLEEKKVNEFSLGYSILERFKNSPIDQCFSVREQILNDINSIAKKQEQERRRNKDSQEQYRPQQEFGTTPVSKWRYWPF